jgi:diphthamide synthase (EF-2-diphthine--ammonia ligase)
LGDKVCAAASLKAILPLWQQDQIVLVNQMLENVVTMIVSCNTMMENSIWENFDQRTSARITQGIDPCGENGEFHTLVLNCPLFSND